MADAASTAQNPTREKMNRSKTFGCSLEKHMLAFALRTVPIDRLLQGEKICKEKTENHSNGSANRNRKLTNICKSQTINYTNRDRTNSGDTIYVESSEKQYNDISKTTEPCKSHCPL